MEIGFQEILCLKLNTIPSAFVDWLLQNTIQKLIQLMMETVISLILEVFKFPNGGTKVTVKTRPNAKEPVVNEWRSQFGDDIPMKIFVKDLIVYLKDKKDARRMFMLNFLVVFSHSWVRQ
ncbi:hypothetical protein R6Q59_024834 [Mikania micrantha]